MKKRNLLIGLMVWCFANSASAQIRKEIEKAKNDPQTEERAAKADASLINLKKVTDGKLPNENNINKSLGTSGSEKKGKKKRSR